MRPYMAKIGMNRHIRHIVLVTEPPARLALLLCKMALVHDSRRRIPVSSSQTLRRMFPDLKIVSMLGSGAYGKVHLAYSPNDEEYAIKLVNTNSANFIQRRWLKSEIKIMQTLKHGNIVRLIQVLEEGEHTIFIMEYAKGGDLRSYINRTGAMTDAEARRIMLQLCEALRYTHGKFIIHRDLKLDNILLDEFNNVKLGDWGFAGEWQPGNILTEPVGSLHYSAPEITRSKPYMGPEVDCWSLGVILYALVTATLPFLPDPSNPDPHHAEVEMRQRIARADFCIPPYVSTTCQALICGLLEPNPRKRLSIDDVLAHDWTCGHAFAEKSVTAAMLRRRASPPALMQSMITPRLATQQTPPSLRKQQDKNSDERVFLDSAVPRPPPMVVHVMTSTSRDGPSLKRKPNSLRKALTSLLTFEKKKSKDIPRCQAIELEAN